VAALSITSGPCSALPPAAIIRKLVADTQSDSQATPSDGFGGDPLRAVNGKCYGYVARAALY
jgi:hypothetical protein